MNLQSIFNISRAAAARAFEYFLFLGCYLWLVRHGFTPSFWGIILLAFLFAAADLALNAIVTHFTKD